MPELRKTIKGLECCRQSTNEDPFQKCGECPYNESISVQDCRAVLSTDALDLLKDYKDCVNELCYQCGQYKREHEGACDDCRWLKPRRGW